MRTIKKAITKTKALAIFRVLFVVLCSLFNNASIAFAQSGFNEAAGEKQGDVATIQGFERIFSNIVSVVLELAGVVLFIMFLTAGFKYITSSGDPKALEGAKGTLTHAIMGLIVLVLAYVILVIIQNVTGANVTNFRVRLN